MQGVEHHHPTMRMPSGHRGRSIRIIRSGVIAPNYQDLVDMSESAVSVDLSVDYIEDESQED